MTTAPDRARTPPSAPISERLRSNLWPFMKFGMVGGINTAVSYGVYLILLVVLPYLVAHVLAWVVGVVVSYFLNARFTYGVARSWRSFALFPLSSLPNIILSSAGVLVMVEVLGWSQVIAPLIATVLAVPIAYLVAKRILVRRK